MTTTDGNGVVFLQTSDNISPFHTLINVLQTATSNAIGALKTRATNLETAVTGMTPTSWTDITYSTGYWNIPAGENTPRFRKENGLVYLNGGRIALTAGSQPLPAGTGTLVGVIPAGFRPAAGRPEFVGAVFIAGAMHAALFQVATNGEISVRPQTSLTLTTAAGHAIVIPSMFWVPA